MKLALLLLAASLHAQTYYVSSTGNDANDCTRTAPCRSMQTAHDKAQSGATLVALDPQRQDSFYISKPITVDGLGHTNFSDGGNPNAMISINSDVGGPVILKNFQMQGYCGTPTMSLVRAQTSILMVENVSFVGCHGIGIWCLSPNISGQDTWLHVQNSLFAGPEATGILSNYCNLSVRSSRFLNLPNGIRFGNRNGQTAPYSALIDQSFFSGNLTVIRNSNAEAPIKIAITRSTFLSNGTFLESVGSHSLLTTRNNIFFSNTVDPTFTGILTLK